MGLLAAPASLADPAGSRGEAAAGPLILGLVVGNGAPPTPEGPASFTADDDALATWLALTAIAPAEDLILLAAPDDETHLLVRDALPQTGGGAFAGPPTTESLHRATRALAAKAAAARGEGREVLLVVALSAPGRQVGPGDAMTAARSPSSGGAVEIGLQDRWLAQGELEEQIASVGAHRIVALADVDHAFPLFFAELAAQKAGERTWARSRELAPARWAGAPTTVLVETRRRAERPSLRGTALAARARACLLGAGDLDRDGRLRSSELARCAGALPEGGESLPLALADGEERPLFDLAGRPGPVVSLPPAAETFALTGPGGLILAAARLKPEGAPPGPPVVVLAPPRAPRTVVVDVEPGSLTPLLGPVTDRSLLEGPAPAADLWGMSADEERELDARLRLAGADAAGDLAMENTLWLAGGVAIAGLGLGLLVAEVGFYGAAAVATNARTGISPVLLASFIALAFGAAVVTASFLAPLFSGPEPAAKGPPPGRGRRRAIASALDTLRDDALWDQRWRWVGAAAGGVAALALLGGAGVALGLLTIGPLSSSAESTRRLLSVGAGGAAALGLGLGAVALVLPLGAGSSARLLNAIERPEPPGAEGPSDALE